MQHKDYELRESNGVYYPSKARPYDDAEYYYATSRDKVNWKIIYRGYVERNFNGSFDEVVDYIEEKNSKIKPRMVHW